jgi:hypothetical protein
MATLPPSPQDYLAASELAYGEASDQTSLVGLAVQAATDHPLNHYAQDLGLNAPNLWFDSLTGFSPATAATTVYTAEYGTAPSSTELNVLVQFTTPQYAHGQQIGVKDPAVYAYQALGVALASTATHFQNTFGPSNPTYPATPAGDAQFSTDAYASVFGHPGSPAQIQEFVSQVNYFKAIYTAAGVYGNANNIDLLARGAAYGQVLGIHAEIDPTGSASGGASHTEVPAGGEASGTDVPLIGVSTTSNMTHTIHLA